MEIDWQKTLEKWKPSRGATQVRDKGGINSIIGFCKYVSGHFWGKIELFSLEIKKELEICGISKNEVFELASIQIPQHGKIWKVRQHKFPDTLSYEFPLFVKFDNYLRYVKFQIKEGTKGLNSPNILKNIWLDFHISNQNLEVIYV